MTPRHLLRLAMLFCLASEKESLPANSDDLSTILRNLEHLQTYAARKEYAENNLKHLSSGSARLVYETPEYTIIKLAKNDKGIAQNQAEANPKMKSPFLNTILHHAKDYAWLETHYLEKITPKQFEKMTGISFEDFGEAIRYGLRKVSENTDISKPKNFEKVAKSSIYQEMERVGKRFHLLPGDLARISSWGCKDDKPVLIDAGLTAEVYDQFYEDTSSSNSKSS